MKYSKILHKNTFQYIGKINKNNNVMDQKYAVDCILSYTSKRFYMKMILGTVFKNKNKTETFSNSEGS